MKTNLRTFPSFDWNPKWGPKPLVLVWRENFEAELRDHMKRNFDMISMGEKLLTLDILGYTNYDQGMKEILGVIE